MFIAKSCLAPLRCHGLRPTWLLCPVDFPGENSGVSCHFLLQRIFPTQGLRLCLLHWQANSLSLSHLGSPKNKWAGVNTLIHQWIWTLVNSFFLSLLNLLTSLCELTHGESDVALDYKATKKIFSYGLVAIRADPLDRESNGSWKSILEPMNLKVGASSGRARVSAEAF